MLVILIFKTLTARRLYKSFGVKGLKMFTLFSYLNIRHAHDVIALLGGAAIALLSYWVLETACFFIMQLIESCCLNIRPPVIGLLRDILTKNGGEYNFSFGPDTSMLQVWLSNDDVPFIAATYTRMEQPPPHPPPPPPPPSPPPPP
jgi:hypothetical protein